MKTLIHAHNIKKPINNYLFIKSETSYRVLKMLPSAY